MISAEPPTGSTEPLPAAHPEANVAGVGATSGLARLAYSCGYYMAFRVTFPVFLAASYIPADSTVGRGLCDGARAARDAHRRVETGAAAAWNKVGDTYAQVAAGMGQRVEGIQDSMAERKHRRRIAPA
ncbi:MAG TPA: hypothetical protein VG125_30800 [Pirellulales bacterium]|jgi:hypothetical protein|nr:hypothetical protein [Pirellulales bacterium]